MDDDKPFDTPVTIDLDGDRRDIATTKEAANCLMMDWPEDRGERHKDAVDACLKVLDGHRSTSDGRAAFVLAAEEAAILVVETSTR